MTTSLTGDEKWLKCDLATYNYDQICKKEVLENTYLYTHATYSAAMYI